ncbi:MAG: hypothetical protein A2W93_04355 [Bacteroidetes bacterium GWF2_43_63]|nr:MAG: hypothetical protein A2W94_12345 [Bacteroidetes bacterium GWE2_42_42]OFY56092.1 MAG: hypothetical protein A2W93_04355 [Bacteroidetes bacterium GWF2_43_63]
MSTLTTEPAGTNAVKPIDERCLQCFLRTYNRLFDKFEVKQKTRDRFFGFFDIAWKQNAHLPAPQIQQLLNAEFGRLVGQGDPFFTEKKENNAIALELYKIIKPQVQLSSDSFLMALRLAIAGNVMDYGAHSSFDINETIDKALKTSFAIDHSVELKSRISTAKNILYLGDNAGEIVFDKLFIETMMHNHVTFAVRGKPILNDVTLEDAETVCMSLVADVVSNGSGNPSTVLSSCSVDFYEEFRKADLIISKGQGNLEGLIDLNDNRIFFLLMAKCDVIAERLGVEKGSFNVFNPQKMQ